MQFLQSTSFRLGPSIAHAFQATVQRGCCARRGMAVDPSNWSTVLPFLEERFRGIRVWTLAQPLGTPSGLPRGAVCDDVVRPPMWFHGCVVPGSDFNRVVCSMLQHDTMDHCPRYGGVFYTPNIEHALTYATQRPRTSAALLGDDDVHALVLATPVVLLETLRIVDADDDARVGAVVDAAHGDWRQAYGVLDEDEGGRVDGYRQLVDGLCTTYCIRGDDGSERAAAATVPGSQEALPHRRVRTSVRGVVSHIAVLELLSTVDTAE